MKEEERQIGGQRRETRLFRLIESYREPFLEVRSSLGLDQRVGFGVCPAAHQGSGEYPFVILPLIREENGRRIALATIRHLAEWHDFDSLLNFHKGRNWRTMAGHEIVAPQFSAEESSSSCFVSFFIHPAWLEESPFAFKIGTLHPAYRNMPQDVFKGGIALTLAQRIDRNYAEVIIRNGYAEPSVKYIKYMQKLLMEYFTKVGIPHLTEEDVRQEESFEDLSSALTEQFPSWQAKNLSGGDERLLRQLRGYRTALNQLREYL